MFYHFITIKILIIKYFQIRRTIKVKHGNLWLHLKKDGGSIFRIACDLVYDKRNRCETYILAKTWDMAHVGQDFHREIR